MNRSKYFLIIVFFFISIQNIFAQPDTLKSFKKLVETGNDGISCSSFKIVGSSGNEVKVPPELFRELKCPQMGILFSPDYRYAVFSNLDTLRIYDFEKDTLCTILIMAKETDGRSFIQWTKKGTRFMFADINQDIYPQMAKIFIIDFINGKCIQNSVVDAPFDYTCGSDCFPNEGAIWFVGEDMLKYRRNENLTEDPGKIISIKLPN